MNQHASSIRRPATYQDVLDAPENMVAELIEGALHLHPPVRQGDVGEDVRSEQALGRSDLEEGHEPVDARLDEGRDLGRPRGHRGSPAVARLASITAIVAWRPLLGLNSTRLVPVAISGRWPGAA